MGAGTSRRNSALIESSLNPTENMICDTPVEVMSSTNSYSVTSGMATPPVIIEIIASGKEDQSDFITKLNKKLTREHKLILQKIEADLELEVKKSKPKLRASKDSQTDSEVDDSESVASAPTTQEEYEHIEEKQNVLERAKDVQKTLSDQCEEIVALRAQMLGEYEQLLSVRTDVMSSQSEEVEKLQQEMATIQQQYEDQMATFQEKVQSQTETTLRAELADSHAKELNEMKQYYETKVSEMEQSYTTDITQLKQEHAELLTRLQGENASIQTMATPPQSVSQLEKQREYVRKTTTLTAISDEDETPPSSPPKASEMLEGRIKTMEDKLRERETLVDELKKRLEAETTSAEDLHGKLLDSNKALCDYEDNFKAKGEEIEELRKILTSKDNRIGELEKEKAALEEKGEKDKPKSESSESDLVEELRKKIEILEHDLSASKESNNKLQQELNQLDAQHGEAIMRLKEEMEKLNKTQLSKFEAGFQIQLEEELKQQADELDNKYKDEAYKQLEEIEIYKQTENELKDQLESIQCVHEKQLSELKEKYETKTSAFNETTAKEAVEPQIEVSEIMEVQTASPAHSVQFDRDLLEATIRENVRAEILEEYEQSIDKLKSDYQERIDDLNSRIQTFESQEVQKSQIADKEKEASEEELAKRESVKSELALEFKERLQNVTEEYENRLKQLQDIVDGKKETDTATSPYLAKSQSLDLDISAPKEEKIVPENPQEYEGFVATIRREYEGKIHSLQTEIAQYQSNLDNVPSTPLSPTSKAMLTSEQAQGDGVTVSEIRQLPDAGSEIPQKSQLESPDIRQELYDEITAEFKTSFTNLRTDYENQLSELKSKLSAFESNSDNETEHAESQIKEQVIKEYDDKIANMKNKYEEKIEKLTNNLEKAISEKTAAEKKVKADMFVWHEEIVTQLKRKHEETISQLRKEYEEKMELYREELQEEFDAEKERINQDHRQDIVDLEDRYDNLVEGIRTGEIPQVAELVQEKFDMELEMAKTLIQQECDETIEAEQGRMSEDCEKQIKQIFAQRDEDLEEQKVRYEKELADLRNSLLQQYQAQIFEMESIHEASMQKAQLEFEALVEKAKLESVQEGQKSPQSEQTVESKTGVEDEIEKSASEHSEKATRSQKSMESKTSTESEIEEDIEKVTSTTDSGTDKSDRDDDDDESGGKGGNGAAGSSETSDEDQGQDSSSRTREEKENEKETESKDKTDDTGEDDIKDIAEEESELFNIVIQQLKQELAQKVEEYESIIVQLKTTHEEELSQLMQELADKETEHRQKVEEIIQQHDQEVKEYQDAMQKLREDMPDSDNSEALELAHQQELQDLEDRLALKHKNEMDNLETRHQSRLDSLQEKHKLEVEQLQKDVVEAQRALDQYPDTMSPVQTVPTFHGGSTLGSTKESVDDFMVPTQREPQTDLEQVSDIMTQLQTLQSQSSQGTATMETQVFETRTSSEDSPKGSLQGTLEEVGVVSLDTTMDQSRGTLRGVDDTQDTELIEFSEEDSDKSMEEDTQKSERSTPTALMQTLGYGAVISGGPTVKSLDDTTDSSFRVSEKEEMTARIKELEGEVEELRKKLEFELSKQDDQMDRLDREKQEESNLTAMLRGDIERLNNDREALQNTNEHLLGLLSDSVKTYMSVEESISKKLKGMMDKSAAAAERSADKSGGDKGRPGSADRRKTPPPSKRSPVTSPGRLSPARADDPDNLQETSILSNVTDEGLDLSQRLSDSIFQGPELASEEEELLIDSGSRLRSSVTHLLDMIDETTSQLLDTKQTQSEVMDTLEVRGHDLEQMASRCNDLEERLREEVERKDFLALELHKAEGLIEGFTTERDTLEQKIEDLEEQKEALVLELETTKNKLLDMTSTHEENEMLKKEMTDQQELITQNVGEEAQATRALQTALEPPGGDDQALILEVTRLNSENREKDQQIKQVHDRYESHVRELETSGEDMEHHYSKILDEKKQEVTDLKLHVDALEKQLKAKKQFIEEQSSEREQEHEDYQKDLEQWKKTVQDLEKQNGAGSRLQREIDDLTEQLQSRMDLHNQALLESENRQREVRDRELSIKELKSIIQQLEQELQDKLQEAEQNKQKLSKLEEELSRRPFSDEELTDSVKSDMNDANRALSIDFDDSAAQKQARLAAQMTVEEELRQAAKKTKEELVREKHALQTQVNECLVQISSLRNQLDDMRHRKDISDVSEAVKRLELEREKSEEKDKEICELKLEVEQLSDKMDNRDQQIEQLRDREKQTRTPPMADYDSERELEKQVDSLKRENKQLRERVKLSEVSSVTDMSGLSQNLLEEKNQEIDHLSGQVLRLQTEFNELKAEKGVEDVYEELDCLKHDLKQKEKEVQDLMSVRVSHTFTDHSLTPDSSMLNVGASFTEKASIQQELEESESNRLERVVSLETEVSALKAVLQTKEEEIVSLQTTIDEVARHDERSASGTIPEDIGMLHDVIGEKEELITQLTVQIDSLQAEVDNLSDFQNKLQEDFDTVQTMLEEKDREIESLTKELTDRSPVGTTEEHSLVIKHEVEIAKLKKDLREKDNVVEEKMEEIAELSDKVELIESHIEKYKEHEQNYDEQIVEKEREIQTLQKQVASALQIAPPPIPLSEDEKDDLIQEKTEEIEKLRKELEEASLGRPPSPPLSQDEKSQVIRQQKEEIESLKENVQKLLGRPPSPPLSEDEKSVTIKRQKSLIESLRGQVDAVSLGRPPSPPDSDGEKADVIHRLRVEIEKLKQQIMDSNLSEDDKSVLIRELKLENETLKKQIDSALKIRPPSPPKDEERLELINKQEKEIDRLRSQVEAALKIRPPSPPRSEEEKSILIREQNEEISMLKKQVEAALQIAPPPPPMSEDEKDRIIELKETEVARLQSELLNVTDATEIGEQDKLVKEKVSEVKQLQNELEEVKQKLESQSSGRLSPEYVEESLKEKEELIEKKDRELSMTKEEVKRLVEELQSAKEVRAYEDEIELKEKEDEIEQLHEELESYRSRAESSLGQSVELELSLGGESGTPDTNQLKRSMSFYKDQYEEKCSQNQQLQVSLDLAKQQLEMMRSENVGDTPEEYKAGFQKNKEEEVEELKNEKDELQQEVVILKEKLKQDQDDRISVLEKELVKAKEEASKERFDNVHTINDMEAMRERKEKERKDSLKTIQELESDLEDKIVKERHLNNQIKQLNEELTVIKKQYGIVDKSSPELKFESQETFELGTDVETLQQQVMHFKQHADKTKEILAEKQKYQSQVVKLEIQFENLQKKMKKDTSQLEEQLKTLSSQPDHKDVWEQLHATQERLEKTTKQLEETGQRLNDTDSSLQRVTTELTSRESEVKELQQDLWKTSGHLSLTSGKLQETEEKLKLTVSQVVEREDQIHQLQGELQHTQQEAEQAQKTAKITTAAADKSEVVEKLRKQLKTTEAEMEAVKKSLTEANEMSEQQLQIAENKDQEFVRLKLDIQQAIAEKEKTIREQKQKIKEKDQEVTKVKQEAQKTLATKERQVAKLTEDATELQRKIEQMSGAGGDATTIATLKAQLQNQEEVILTLESDLKEVRNKVQDRDKEIDDIHNRHDQSRSDESDTIDAMHNQIAMLQRELEELRSAAKGQESRSQDDRDQSPYDQNGRSHDHQQPRIDGANRQGQRRSPEQYEGQDDGTFDLPCRRRSYEQDDSGLQSYEQHASGKPSLHQSPEGQSSSPQQQTGQPNRVPSPQESSDEQSRGHHTTQGQGHQHKGSPRHQRGEDQQYRGRPDNADGFDHRPEGQSPPVRLRGQGQQYDEQFSQETEPKSQAVRVQQPSNLEGQNRDQTEQFYGNGGTSQRYQEDNQEISRQRTSPVSSSPLRSVDNQFDHQGHMLRGRRSDQEAGDDIVYDNGERYIGEDGQLYDRDGNLRPRYSHSSEGQQSQRSQRGQVEQFPTEDQQGEASGEGQIGDGSSGETDRYIQQLRRELLITKTALMQLQRGSSLERAVSPDEAMAEELVQDVISRAQLANQQETAPQISDTYPQQRRERAEFRYEAIPLEEEVTRLRQDLEKAEDELELYRTSSNLTARDFVQKVMNLKDELSGEHQRHIHEMTSRAHQDTEAQLATMRIKYMDEIEHIKRLHGKELEEKLRDLTQKMERKHKGELNKLVVRHQEEVSILKSRGASDLDNVTLDLHHDQRQGGVGQDRNGAATVNGHSTTSAPMSGKLKGILRRLHSEGVQVLTISELEFLNRSQSQADLPHDADPESMKAGWENERQSLLSTIQSLKDLLAQTHKLRGLEKSIEGSDWRAELLRAIGYVFTKERESLLAELRSHVLSHPSSNVDEIQRLEQKIRTQEAHHHASLDQIFNADRQSMLAEIRDLHAHATIARMHNQEERERLNEKVTSSEDQALKKERQLKRQVQLLEFKIQQERVLQEDLRTSLDSERNRSGDLSGLLNQEKSSNLDHQSKISALQVHVGKLKESLEREQSRYVSVTNALEEEKSKSLNLSDLLESERETLWRLQSEIESLKKQQTFLDPRAIEQLQAELEAERERRCQSESRQEIDRVTMDNLRQEVEMEKRHQHSIETEMSAKISQMHKVIEIEKQKNAEMDNSLERERMLSARLQRSLEAEKSNSEELTGRERALIEDLQMQLETERANVHDLNNVLQREQASREDISSSVESEKNLLRDHLNQERTLNEDLKHEVDKLQFERLEAVNKLQKERDVVQRLKTERDQTSEELRKLKSREMQRDHDRESERLGDKKSVRQADREREDFRMKLHEQELELQRITQKALSLEEELVDCRENELKAIRELEQERLRSMQMAEQQAEMISVQTSPRPAVNDGVESMEERRKGAQVYRSQLESMCQSLHYLILRCREQLNKASHTGQQKQWNISDFDALQKSLRDLLSEVKQLQEMEGDFISHPSGSVNERILRQNEELTNFVARISEEKTELRNTLTRLEEEIWRYRQMDGKYQEMQRSSKVSDNVLTAERAEWAKEKLSLQMALNSAEREIDLLQTDLRVERERRVAAGITDARETDKVKIQRIYGKYLRSESFRKALIYQKKYLLVLLGGFQDTEETTLALLDRMGAIDQHGRRRHRVKPLTTFRGAVRVVIAIARMKYLVKKWRRATRVGSEVVGGTVDQTNGYVPQTNSYSPHYSSSPRIASVPARSASSPPRASSSSYHRHLSPQRSSIETASLSSPRSHLDYDSYASSSYMSTRPTATHVPSTPPTKDYSSTTRYTSPSSGARRKILTSASIPASSTGRVRFMSAEDSKNGDLGDSDDYIHRLENLQTRLGTLQNGNKMSWKQPWR